MPTPVNYNGNTYFVPAFGDGGYAQGAGNLSLYLIALATGSLTSNGGLFTLTNDVNFGGSFGLLAKYFTSVTASPATSGVVRLANTDVIDWRNFANSGNDVLGVNTSDQLTFNGVPVAGTGAGVTSIIGTANEIIASSPTGAVTLSTPQPIATTSTPTFAGETLTGTLAMGANKITGLANGTVATDAVAFGQLSSFAPLNSPVFTGTPVLPNINGTFIGLGRNRILNGDMIFDQRLEGGLYSTAGGAAHYCLDQWRYEDTGLSTFTVVQTNDNLPNSFFTKALKVQTTVPHAVSASDGVNMEYPMETVYQSDWAWGTASAVPVTLSFWTLSSKAGTYSVALLNGVNSRAYVTTYSIPVANVWYPITITIPGDTTGPASNWPTSGNSFGLKVVWDLGSGSGVETGSPNTWLGTSVWKVTGSTSLVTTGDNWYLTGVQLEIGNSATAFEYHPYSQELAALQRYYWKSFPQGTAVAQASGFFSGCLSYVAQNGGIIGNGLPVLLPVPMLGAPAVTTYNPASSNNKWRNESGSADSGVPTIFTSGTTGFFILNPQVAGDGLGTLLVINASASAVLGGE